MLQSLSSLFSPKGIHGTASPRWIFARSFLCFQTLLFSPSKKKILNPKPPLGEKASPAAGDYRFVQYTVSVS